MTKLTKEDLAIAMEEAIAKTKNIEIFYVDTNGDFALTLVFSAEGLILTNGDVISTVTFSQMLKKGEFFKSLKDRDFYVEKKLEERRIRLAKLNARSYFA